jgi:hypothetical protein
MILTLVSAEYWERPRFDIDHEPCSVGQEDTTISFIKDSPTGLVDSPSTWDPIVPDVYELPNDLSTPNKPHLDFFGCKTSSQAEVIPSRVEIRRDTVKPLEVSPNRLSISDSLHLARAGSGDVKSDISSKSGPQSDDDFGKPARQTPLCVSAADAKITEVIKTALSTNVLGSDTAVHPHPLSLEKSNVESHDDPWTSNSKPSSNFAHTDLSDPSESEILAEKKAIAVLSSLRAQGYTISISISKDRALPRPLNPGSAASNKSERAEICQECKRFRGRPCEMKFVTSNYPNKSLS